MKKFLCLLLAFAMLVANLPVLSFASETVPETLEGKTLSILGDSISTFAGISNNASYNATIGGSAVYYSGGTLGVYQADTWWQQAIDALGMELLVNNSWSGSCILPTRSGTAGAYVSRCVQLHNTSGAEPDVIAVFMGTNDFSYYQSTLGTADIDYAALIADNGDGTFTYATPATSCEAYAIMLHKMTTRYPDAEIYCMTLLPRRNPPEPTAFNAELSKVIEHFGCTVVDLENCGISADATEFDKYITDKRVHPGPEGMDKITEALLSALLNKDTTIYDVSSKLTNVTMEGGHAVLSGGSYSATLTEANGFTGMDVTVTMGGEDITASAYADGTISIASVTGDISITAAALEREAKNFRWEFDGTDLVSMSSGSNEVNNLTKMAGSTTDGVLSDTVYKMGTGVLLCHERPWVMEFRASGSWSGMIFSHEKSAGTVGNTFLFKTTSDSGFIGFGERNGNQYHNYGIALAAQGVDTTAEHTYRLENRIESDGSNMVYLLVDGVDYGAMNHYFIGATSDQGTTVNWLSGKDLVFSYIGASGHAMNNCALDYIQVWEGGLTHAVPESEGVANAIKHAYALTDVEWTPLKNMPGVKLEDGVWGYQEFEAGVTYKGIPYSGVIDTDTYVGLNVSLESFVTAVQNKNSVLYTENLFVDSYPKKATYFGTVCSKFAQYVLDIPGSYNTYNIPNIPGMDTIAMPGEYTADQIRLGDVVVDTSYHTAVCTDILYDADGNVVYIEISEALPPTVRRLQWSVEDFFTEFANYRLCRYQYIGNVPAADAAETADYALMPRFGNKYNYKVSSSEAVVDILETGYSKAVVLRDGAVIDEIAIDDTTETVSFDRSKPGYIEMYLEKADGTKSESVYACVVESSVKVTDNTTFYGGKLTVEFSGTSGTPLYVQVGTAHAVFCPVSSADGTATIEFKPSAVSSGKVRVAYQNEYGIYLSGWSDFVIDDSIGTGPNPSTDKYLSQGVYWDNMTLTPTNSKPAEQENKQGYWTYTMIPVEGNTTYYSVGANRMWFFDADGNAISTHNAYTESEVPYRFTTPENAAHVSISYSPDLVEQGTESMTKLLWEQGTIASATGLNRADTTRLRTVDYLRLSDYGGVGINPGYTMTNFVYDENMVYLGTSSWLGSGVSFTTAELQEKYPTGKYFRIALRTLNSATVTVDDIAATGVTFYAPGEEIPVPESDVKYEDIMTIGTWQDGAIYDGKLFVLGGSGTGAVYDLATQEKLGSLTLDNKDVLKPHANSVCFGSTYYAEGDQYPLLYVNIYNNYSSAEDRMEGTCCVYRVTETDGQFATELVQVIEIGFTEDLTLWKSKESNGDVRPYGNFVVDTDNDKLYAFVMRDAEKTTRFFRFDLPALTVGTYNETYGCNVVTLESTDIEAQFDTEYFNYLQGCCYYDGMLISAEGFNSGGSAEPALRIVDLDAQQLVKTYYPAEAGLTKEPEVVCADLSTGKVYYAAADGVLRKLTLESTHFHTYEFIVTDPTCTEQGYTTHTCSVCGDSYVDSYVDATGDHSYAYRVTFPKNTVKGYTDYVCTVCDYAYQTAWLVPAAYEGKTLAAIGDSITAGVGVTADQTDYVYLLAQQLGMEYIRLGASGTTLCTDGHRTCNIGKLTEGNLADADVVTILMGINDFCNAQDDYYTLGDITSTDTSTIYGAVRMWCEKIQQLRQKDSMADTQFYFLTPVITSWNNSVSSSRDWDQSKVNIHGYTLRDLCNAIVEVCALYDIPVIDLNLTSGLYYVSAKDNNITMFGGDGVHPGVTGHEMMADALENALLQNDLRNDHAHAYGSWIITDYPNCKEGTEMRVCAECKATESRALAATGHNYESVVTKPTCNEKGYTTHTCSVCGDSHVDSYVDALGHSYGDWTIYTVPTCTEKGEERRDCGNCDHFESREVEATGHDYEDVVTAPTCVDRGYTTHICSKCDDSYVDSYVDATGKHAYTEGICSCGARDPYHNKKAVICFTFDDGSASDDLVYQVFTEKGMVCDFALITNSRFQKRKSIYLEYERNGFGILSHSKTHGAMSGADCTDEFLLDEMKGSLDILTANGFHNVGGWVTPYSVLNKNHLDTLRQYYRYGYTVYYGTYNGTKVPYNTLEDDVHSLHRVSMESTTQDSLLKAIDETVANKGFLNFYAHNFSNGLTRSEMEEVLDYVRKYVDSEQCIVTTTSEGVEYYYSKNCNHTFRKEMIAPDCMTRGYTEWSCELCHIAYKDSYVSAIGHNYKAVVTKPTCTDKGYTTHTCSKCGDSYMDSYVDATGHKFGDWTVTTEPTCTEKGEERRDCENCEHFETREIDAAGHDYEAVVTDPTCTEKGYTTFTCKCGDTYKDNFVDAKGHSEVTDEAVAATCTATGLSEGKHCSVCSEVLVKQQTVAASGHIAKAAVEENRKESSCEAAGSYQLVTYCGTCGAELERTNHTIPATGHAWDKGTVTKEPGEYSEGEKTFKCTACGKTKTESIPALGHSHSYSSTVTKPTCTEQGYTTYTCKCGDSYKNNFVDAVGHKEVTDESVAPTCTATGLSEGKHCSVCGEVLVKQQVVPATGHAPKTAVEENRKNAACETAGSYQLVTYCGTCGAELERTNHTIPAAGHAWDKGTVTKEPGEYSEGEKTFKCNACGKTNTESIPALGHTHSYTSTVTKPTCTEQGYTTYTCQCGDSYKTDYVKETDHSMGTWTVATAPTCTATGVERRDCTNCDHFETREAAAKGHSYEAVVTEPTCVNGGYTTHTCACGDSYVDSKVGALGHNWDDGTVTKEPTETETGVRLHTCANCGQNKTVSIPALGHTHSYSSTVTKPTCTEQGYTTFTCKCGDSYVDDYVGATGHAEVIDGAKAATCTETGLTEGKHCSVCGKVLAEQKVVAATGHSFGEWVTVVEPTTEVEGKAERKCACGETENKTLPKLEGRPRLGDVNNDGKLNAKDATLILRYSVKKYTDYPAWFEQIGDVNGDGRVNAKDATLILRFVVDKADIPGWDK